MATLTIRALIKVDSDELTRTGATTEQLIEGIHARLHPVVSCDPDETRSANVTVTLEAVER